MICGNCKEHNSTVAHVRDCYNKKAIEALLVSDPTPENLSQLAARGEDVSGIYVKDGLYFKVVQSPDTGRWYAKRWEGSWDYEGRAPLYSLTVENRATSEQAAHFGQLYGLCVFCTRTLTDERSIEVGYGPVCAERENLPWGEHSLPWEHECPECPANRPRDCRNFPLSMGDDA